MTGTKRTNRNKHVLKTAKQTNKDKYTNHVIDRNKDMYKTKTPLRRAKRSM